MQLREYRDLTVSLLGFGAGHIGGEMDEDRCGHLLNALVDSGVTLIDTARGYGLSEERIGRHLSWRRNDFVLSTKVGYGVEGHADWTAGCIHAGIDRALGQLRTDHIDIVHLHSCPRPVLVQGDVIRALLDARSAGKIRYAAYSGDNEDLEYALECGLFDGFEASFNVCDQRIVAKLLPLVRDAGGGFIAKRPIANAPWRFKERPVGNYAEEYWLRWQTMALPDFGIPLTELALRFSLFTDGVSSGIIGSANLEHVSANIKALDKGPLPPEIYAAVRSAFERHGASWLSCV